MKRHIWQDPEGSWAQKLLSPWSLEYATLPACKGILVHQRRGSLNFAVYCFYGGFIMPAWLIKSLAMVIMGEGATRGMAKISSPVITCCLSQLTPILQELPHCVNSGGWNGLIMNNKKYSSHPSHPGNVKGFRLSVPGTLDEDQIHIYFLL